MSSAARLVVAGLRARPRRIAYGPHRSQRCELWIPHGAAPADDHRVCVLVHGGSWQAKFGKWTMWAVAADLVSRGWAVWNVEYRRTGTPADAGGWPATFADAALGLDRLADVMAPIDLDRVVVVGHSAGGQLALWLAGPRNDGPAGPSRVRLRAAVSQAGVNAMADAWEAGGPVEAVIGGTPTSVPERYRAIDPVMQVPLTVPVLLVHGSDDDTVLLARSEAFAYAARAAGDDVELVVPAGKGGTHRAHVNVDSDAWAVVPPWLDARVPR